MNRLQWILINGQIIQKLLIRIFNHTSICEYIHELIILRIASLIIHNFHLLFLHLDPLRFLFFLRNLLNNLTRILFLPRFWLELTFRNHTLFLKLLQLDLPFPQLFRRWFLLLLNSFYRRSSCFISWDFFLFVCLYYLVKLVSCKGI